MEKLKKWLRRVIFVYITPDEERIEDRLEDEKNYTKWKKQIQEEMVYCDLNSYRVVKVRGLLAFFTYSLMKGRH